MLFKCWFPGHQTEFHSVVEHGEAPTGEHHGASVDTTDDLAISDGPVPQSGFRLYVLSSGPKVPVTQCSQQVASKNYTLIPVLG